MEHKLARVSRELTGMPDGLWGDVTGIRGDATGIRGDVTGLSGDLDTCEIVDWERARGIDVEDLVQP